MWTIVEPRLARCLSPLADTRCRGAPVAAAPHNGAVPHPLTLPGFVDAHCHAFQRALRGRTQGGDFWAWRGEMLALAAEQTPERVRSEYAVVYRELRRAGYTAVGEFHYRGFEQALAAGDAAEEAGIELVLLYAAYARGGAERF